MRSLKNWQPAPPSAAATDEDRQFSGKFDKLLITPPADCAADILRGLLKGKKRIIMGNKSSTIFWMARLFPSSCPRLLKMLG